MRKKWIPISLLIFSLSTSAFPMGARRPSTTSSTVVTKINNTLPLIESLLPLFGRVTPLLSSVLPVVGNILPLFGSLIPKSNPSPDVSIPSGESPTNIANSFYRDQIIELSETSTCAQVDWKNRGVAPIGYVKGMGLSFARSLCRLKSTSSKFNSIATILGRVVDLMNSKNQDALSSYQQFFSTLKNSSKGALRAVYGVGMGLGMEQSAGRLCALNGLFPAGLSMSGLSSQMNSLYQHYKTAGSSFCLSEIFSEGTNCTTNLASTTFIKTCPGYSTELMMTWLRDRGQTLGAIASQSIAIAPECEEMFQNIQDLVEGDPENACTELL